MIARAARIVSLAIVLLACATRAAPAQTCVATVNPVVFGAYDPGNAVASTSSGSVTVTCSALVSILVSYTVQLGSGGGGGFAPRRMSGAGALAYNLYIDVVRSTVWGDGTAGTSVVADGYLLILLVPQARTYTAYAAIPARQLTAPGAYADTVSVLVTY